MGNDNFNSRVAFTNIKWMIQDPILEKLEKYSFFKPLLKFFKVWFPENIPLKNNKRITLKKIKNIETKINLNFTEKRIDESKDMAIIFTSGTTGVPKGVVHTYITLFSGLSLIKDNINIDHNDVLYASQLYFLLIGLMIPSKIYIGRKRSFNAKNFLKQINKYNISTAFLLPYEGQKIYSYSKRVHEKIPQSLKNIFFGSAPVTNQFLNRFSKIEHKKSRTVAMYGSTEMLIISLISSREKIDYDGSGDILGKPLKGIDIYVGKDSELKITGPQKFDRYLELEKSNFFESGDLGYIDSGGMIIMTGRKKDMIIREGINVYPGIFEGTIRNIPGVVDIAMVGRYSENKEDEEILLFIELMNDIKFSQKQFLDLLKFGKYSIDQSALPDYIYFIKNLPYSGRSKKVDKNFLRINY